MTKKVCCSIVLAVLVYLFTMILCVIYVPYPDLISPIVGYYSVLMAVIAFLAYGFGERQYGSKLKYSVLFAVVMWLFTMLLTIFIAPFQELVIKMAFYYAGIAFLVAFISYMLGRNIQKNK